MTSFEEIRQLINTELKKRSSRPSNEGQLADALKISRPWFSRMMNERKLKIMQLLKIAEILEIEPAALLPGTHNPDSEASLSLEEHLWFFFKGKVDKYIDEKLIKINMEVKNERKKERPDRREANRAKTKRSIAL
ncbi:hypothetical protein ES707_06713 [subsurface metagenome]